jgi:acyl-CoA synthetase (AMP-forming)/AMP-acid ligase II
MAAVPPLWLQMLGDTSPFTRMEFPDLRYITNTGGVFPAKAVEEYRRLLPHVRIYLMYGLSEAFRSTYLPPEEINRRQDSIGKAIPETVINVVKDGRECEPGEVGELVHRGPTVALGYWRDPEATARVFRPFHDARSTRSEVAVYSGDYVKRDAEGFLYFVGRRDAMIKTQGFRVSPEEVEEVILASGLVREAAAVAEPDELAGSVIVVHLVPKDSATFSEASLFAFCRRGMPRHMVPRSIHLHEALPRTGTGKFDRKKLAS